MVILFFQYLQEQHQQQQQEQQQQCHKEVKYTVTQFPQFKKNICSALQHSVCSKNKGGRAPLDPSAESATEKD